MFCSKCGTKIPDDSAFCYQCGARVVTQASAAAPQAETGGKDAVQKGPVTEKELLDAYYRSAECDVKDDFWGALSILSEYKERAWDNDVFLLKLGRAYRRCNMPSKALECYMRAAEVNPNNATIYVNAGAIYLLNGEYEDAVKLYKAGVDKINANPVEYNRDDIGVALANYGAALAGLGRKKEGEAYIRGAESYGYPNGDALREKYGLKNIWFK